MRHKPQIPDELPNEFVITTEALKVITSMSEEDQTTLWNKVLCEKQLEVAKLKFCATDQRLFIAVGGACCTIAYLRQPWVIHDAGKDT